MTIKMDKAEYDMREVIKLPVFLHVFEVNISNIVVPTYKIIVTFS